MNFRAFRCCAGLVISKRRCQTALRRPAGCGGLCCITTSWMTPQRLSNRARPTAGCGRQLFPPQPSSLIISTLEGIATGQTYFPYSYEGDFTSDRGVEHARLWTMLAAHTWESSSALAVLQGTYIKRHAIPTAEGRPLRPGDVTVGRHITLYGHEIYVVDADAFTRAHLASQG